MMRKNADQLARKIVLADLTLTNHRSGLVTPQQPNTAAIKVYSKDSRRYTFSGDKVLVDTETKQIVLNYDTEQRLQLIVTMLSCVHKHCKEAKHVYEIRENGDKSWWRCRDHSCKGKLRLESGHLTATTGEHNHLPSQAQASANTVISSMRKRAREESVPLPRMYQQELPKLSGTLGCDETVDNIPSFQNLKSSLYRSRLQRFPTLPQS